jgi:hypothetical protein
MAISQGAMWRRTAADDRPSSRKYSGTIDHNVSSSNNRLYYGSCTHTHTHTHTHTAAGGTEQGVGDAYDEGRGARRRCRRRAIADDIDDDQRNESQCATYSDDVDGINDDHDRDYKLEN